MVQMNDAVAGVADLLSAAAREHPDKVALVEAEGRARTWVEVDDEASRVATGLGAAGLVAGYRVAIAMTNRIEFVATYLGVLRARLVAVPVNPRSTVDELERIFTDSGARMVVADQTTVTAVREAVARVQETARPRVVVVGTTLQPGERSYDHLVATAGRPLPQLRDPETLAALLYTSGTSGRPRAAMLSHRALLANIEQVASVDPPMIGADDVVLGVLPLFHVYGLNAVLGGTLWQRAKLLLVERFDPSDTLDLIEDEACSVLPVAPPVFAHWLPLAQLRERLGSVRLVMSGSAPLSPQVAARFTEATGIAVHQGYGLTEAAPVVTSTLHSHDLEPGSVGSALPGIELRLLDDNGRPPEGEDGGEIWVKGPNLFSGYWPDGADGPDADGWWATGDVGFLDPDGDLFLVDRLRELVIVSGFNVYPAEVEAVIEEVDGVRGAAVIGVADELTGEAVVAYVQASDGTEGLVERVREHCGVRLARFKQPSRIEVVDELPLTVTGKVQKGRLRAVERRRALSLLEGE
jgi:long-chain acyl-CoA synthetase